jgi:hypothetical protein
MTPISDWAITSSSQARIEPSPKPARISARSAATLAPCAAAMRSRRALQVVEVAERRRRRALGIERGAEEA